MEQGLAVEMHAFDASPVTEGILLTWDTSFESNHLGFHVHRAGGAERSYLRLSDLIEPPGPYRFLDPGQVRDNVLLSPRSG